MKHYRTIIALAFVFSLTALFSWLVPVTVASPTGGTVNTCDETNLTNALSGGGLVTFNCGGPATITVSTQKTIGANTTIDGFNNGFPLTLTAVSGVRLVYLNPQVSLTLMNVTIANLNGGLAFPIFNSTGGRIIISNSRFYNNQTGIIQSNGPVTVTGSIFSGTASQEAIYMGLNQPLSVSNSQFISNSYGAISAQGPVVIDNSQFNYNNRPQNFGAVFMRDTVGGPLTITNSSFISNTGGALVSYGGNIYINASSFLSNTVGGAGAGLWFSKSSTYDVVRILNSTFQGNTGGAILANGGGATFDVADTQFINNVGGNGALNVLSMNAVTVTGSSFIGNSTNLNSPGGLSLSAPGWISGTSFIRNSGSQGGALYMSGSGNTVYITNTQFLTNTSTTNDGAAIRAVSGNVFLSGVNVSSNHSLGTGGIAVLSPSSIVNIDHSLFYSNTTSPTGGTGGAMYSVGPTSITNSTIYSNTAYLVGGIFAGNSLTLTNVTVLNNRANYSLGTGNFQQGGITPTVMVNTIIAGGSPKNCAGNLNSLGYNLSSDASCTLNATGDFTNTNPLLGPFQDNGGSTYTLMPTVSSPATNGGSNAYCPADDQRGITRPIGGTCDIGASESPYLSQSIVFAALPHRLLTQSPFTVSATATSGLTVYFTASGQCTHSDSNGTTITLTAYGSCVVTAHQDGNANYAAAPLIVRTFTILRALYLPLILR